MSADNILCGPKEYQPIPHGSLGRFMYDSLRNHGNKTAQVHAVTGVKTTYADVLARSLLVAENLRARGVKQGDVIGVSSENRLEFCLPVLAATYLGVTCAPINPLYTAREMHHSLSISRPKVVFCSPYAVKTFVEVSRQLSFIEEVVVFDGVGDSSLTPFSSYLQRTSGYGPLQPVHLDPDTHNATILCSSGTTGLPKGVMVTDKSFLTCIMHLMDPRFGCMKENDIILGVLPFFHAYAFITQIANLAIGMTTVVMPKFDEKLFLHSVQEHKVTLLLLVPPLLVFLAKHPLVPTYDLSSVRDIWSGAAPLSRDVQMQVTRRIGIRHIRQGYGLTETTLAVLLTPQYSNKYGSSGLLAPSTRAKVVDLDTGKTLGPNCKGELCFDGPLIMKGYCGDRQATSATIDSDGFLHTGDIGYYDTDNYFYVVDRLKELIKYKGFQVPPAELEAVLLTHPAIKDAAVIGVPDEAVGELPLAFIVKQPGVIISEHDIIQYVSGQVSPQKRLHGGVRFVDVIPKTPSGKILRRELRQLLKSKL